MYKKVEFGPTKTNLKRGEGGVLHYMNTQELGSFPTKITDKLQYWATLKPDHTFLARKQKGSWNTISYHQTWEKTNAVAAYLLSSGLKQGDTIAILSENSLEHAILALAALHIGIVHSPISPAYSLLSKDLAKLKHCLELLNPKLIFAQSGKKYERALKLCTQLFPEALIVTANDDIGIHFETLTEKNWTEKVAIAAAKVNGTTNAKVLFTSGSTGIPKGVINHHEMWCSNLQQIVQMFPFARQTPTFIDWLPWNHTFGGNHNFGLALYNGGTLYIDDGKPNANDILETVQNLKEISPTIYFNVPKGFEMLIPYLESDQELRENFFKNLNMMFYAGASLAQPVWNTLEELSLQTTGFKIPIISGFGSTESGPSAMFANWSGGFSGLLGIPVAGMDLKLIPNGNKMQASYKAPNVTKGYYKNEIATKNAFDSEGYFLTGDAVKFFDEDNPDKGLIFDGRITEDFKLSTGTWVNVGVIREKALKLGAPILQDIVLTGMNASFLGAILFLNQDACSNIIASHAENQSKNFVYRKEIYVYLEHWLKEFNSTASGSSTHIKKYIIADEPPSIELGEITDKGSINQRAVLQNRPHLIQQIYDSTEV